MKDFEDVNVITLDFKEGAEKFSQDDWLVDGLFKKGTFNIITGSYEEGVKCRMIMKNKSFCSFTIAI